jgi:hypothetical protein
MSRFLIILGLVLIAIILIVPMGVLSALVGVMIR